MNRTSRLFTVMEEGMLHIKVRVSWGLDAQTAGSAGSKPFRNGRDKDGLETRSSTRVQGPCKASTRKVMVAGDGGRL